VETYIVIEQTKTYRFWTSFLWMVVILGLFVIGQFVPILLYMLGEGMGVTRESFSAFTDTMGNDVRLLFLSAFGGIALVLPTIWWIVKRVERETLKEGLYLYGASFLSYVIWFLVLILTFVGMGLLIHILGVQETPNFMLNLEYPTPMHKILLLVAVVIIAPIVEEVVFRGFLQKRFSGTFLGIHGAIFVTAFIWAVIHGQYESVYIFVIFLIGIIFGYARVISNSLYIPIMMHAVLNLWSTLGLFYEKGVI
jgi:membrane protease YdiL (CAAX protease family)